MVIVFPSQSAHHPVIDFKDQVQLIASSYDGSLIAAADQDRCVQIWNLSDRCQISTFETTIDFGGKRLAISRNGGHCGVGAYDDYGIALYKTSDGTEVWRRKDLKKVQGIRLSNDDRQLMCGFADKPYEFLGLTSGQSERTLYDVEDAWQSNYDDAFFIRGRSCLITDSEFNQVATVRRTSFGILGCAFAPGKICTSEPRTLVRCYDLQSGQKQWRYDPGNGNHAVQLTYIESDQLFAAVILPYKSGGDRLLVTLREDNGEVVKVTTIGNVRYYAFCSRGSILLTSDGKIRSTVTGEVEGVLDFFHGTEGAD
jgi:WD40 repeat protein